MRTAWSWLERHPGKALALAVVVAIVLRLPFLGRGLENDEGGFLMVARQWHDGGTSLYGDQWVDRPPLLLLIFKLAGDLGGSAVIVHAVSAAFGVLLVMAAWWAGRAINGARRAAAAALVAAFLGSNFLLGSTELTGEGMAGALVMVSCASTLQAKRRLLPGPPAVLLTVAGGAAASMAFLIKQNFVDGAVFALVLLAPEIRRTWRLALGFTAGAVAPLAVTAGWAASAEGPGLGRLWHAVFTFRQQALDVLTDSSSTAPYGRLRTLLVLFLVSGLVALSAQLLAACLRVVGHRDLRRALPAMWLYGVVGVALGGDYWRHYLLALVPVLTMGTALATCPAVPRLRPQSAATYTALAAIVPSVVGAVLLVSHDVPGSRERVVAAYLRQAAHPGDGLFVAYGEANLIWDARLRAPYPYSWSLPLRGRDPHLDELVETLKGPDAPTWLVEYGRFGWWGLDTSAFQQVRAQDYHVVATVCGHAVYLRDGAHRVLPPTPTCTNP